MPWRVNTNISRIGCNCSPAVYDDNVVRMDWLWSNALGGIKLLVREKDAPDAAKVLDALAQDGDGAGIES